MAFLHGVETITITKGNRTITAVPSAIIVLVGIAPKGPVNIPTLVAGSADVAQFGSRLPGFNIPEALDSIFAQGAGIIVVINTFDGTVTTNTSDITDEVATIADNKFKLAFAPVGSTVPVVTDAATGLITYVAGTDYTIDDFGNGVVINTTAISASTVKVTYKKLNTTSVNANQIIGTVDGTTQARSGLQALDNIPTLFGFKPKIIISPGYSALPTVSAAMLSKADTYRAVVPMDAPEGTTAAAAITGRGSSGTFGWNTGNSRAILVFPKWKKGDPDPSAASDATILEWYSSLFAGVMSNNDYSNGFWFSPSNKEIKGVVGPEIVITCSLTDSTAQNQLLNSNGIVCYFNSFGTSLLTWGNRSAMYPSDTQPINFINIQRIKDILEESIEVAMFPYIDQPINNGTIDSVRATVNGFIRSLILRGALIDGLCIFDPTLNPTDQLAAGQVVFSLSFMGPTPMERIRFNSFVDVSLLSKLLAS
jgi:phage tail sheath protein FI